MEVFYLGVFILGLFFRYILIPIIHLREIYFYVTYTRVLRLYKDKILTR